MPATAEKWVYAFEEGSKDDRALLGGKGANIAEMSRIGDPVRVPAGFTVTTAACVAYMNGVDGAFPEGLDEQIDAAIAVLEQRTGKQLGVATDPLLVSVRSGARDSMPGMMDTVLNLGLSDEAVAGLAARTGDERFAWDCYRRFVQMFGNVVRGIDGTHYEEAIAAIKQRRGVRLDTELSADDLSELVATFKDLYREQAGEQFPDAPRDQLLLAVRAVFDSWNGARAIEYRRLNMIPDDWGTAVNVQQMVFGNMGDNSGSGVAFSRDEINGAPQPSGDYLPNAQGEDVVSGVRNTESLEDLAAAMPEIHAQLIEILRMLERHYGDMQDVEFTVEDGTLYMLQTRSAKRPPHAAVRVAVDLVAEGITTREQALARLDTGKLDALLHPAFDPNHHYEPLTTGVAASPGAARGAIVFTAEEAVAQREEGNDVILVRPFTEADDVAGFHAARGILTSEGGKASHAALVARGMGRPCVCGASELDIDLDAGEVRVNGSVLRRGDLVAIDGTTGNVTTEDVPLVEAQIDEYFRTVLDWSDELRRLDVRANADTPRDAATAKRFGANGIGLCRTEHMFFSDNRAEQMRDVILAEDEPAREQRLAKLLPLQRGDFEGLFEQMSGLPVTIRLLDPPLHEFLPSHEDLAAQITHLRDSGEDGEQLAELERQLHKVKELEEVNPMLGTRGCRLGIIYPEIYAMQIRAIVEAAAAARDRSGAPPKLEIMIPLVDYPTELKLMRELVQRTAADTAQQLGVEPPPFMIGTMIELPRACLMASEIAAHAEFFSFGTNDLTQTTLGFSRDDAEGGFLSEYLQRRIIDRSPFETVDVPGVGALVELAAQRGREARPGIELGICGEHGGDPASIGFFHRAGLDYVSCSPYRVPIARVAAAQAAIADTLA